MDMPLGKRQRILSRKSALWNERSSWITHWREISDYQQPRAGRFVATDRNRGDKRTRNDIDRPCQPHSCLDGPDNRIAPRRWERKRSVDTP